MITSSVYYTTDPHAAANDLRELLPDATIGIYWHESIPIVTIEQPGREQKTFLQPRHRLVTHDGGKTLITEPVLSDQEKYRQLQSRITRLEREVREERAEGDDVRERLRAVIACRVWNDLGRGFVFADDLRHAVDPELYPEPMPVRLDSDAAVLALVQARAATDDGNRTPLADVLTEHGMTEADMEVEG